jgi:hypothetical protein
MAWRLGTNLIDGTLDNTTPGKVTGTLRFIGRKRAVRIDLAGDILGDGGGKRLMLKNPNPLERNRVLPLPRGRKSQSYMTGFAAVQRGAVGTMTVDERGCYLEWYGEKNGRTVIELPREQFEIVNE